MLGRLTTVIDCGTMNGEKRIQLGFQLADIDVTPQDPSLPVYKQFAKTQYGGMLKFDDPMLIQFSKDLGCELSADGFISKAGCMLDIAINESEYQGKPQYIVMGISPVNDVDEYDWGVGIKTFQFTNDTTLEEIKELGFDNKNPKNSDEYNIIKQVILDSEEVPF